MKEHQISFEEYEARFIPTDYMAFLKAAPTAEIQSAFVKHYAKFARGEYKKIMVSVSGGADSDRMVDLIERIGYPAGTVIYCYFDTGMEYKATKDHLSALEQKYGIQIRKKKRFVLLERLFGNMGIRFCPRKLATIFTDYKATISAGKIVHFRNYMWNIRVARRH